MTDQRHVGAVLFDMDGVLVDTEPWWRDVRIAFAEARGRTWTDADNRACMGVNTREWATIMRERLGIDESLEQIEATVLGALVARYASEPTVAIPGAAANVRRVASAVPVALASGAHRSLIDAALAVLGLTDVFGAVVPADEVARGKPAPDVFLEAARRLGVAPAACLVVEDSGNGVRAGKAAGMRVALIPNHHTPPDGETVAAADAVLASLDDLDLGRFSA